MTKQDLKVGMVVEIKNTKDNSYQYRMVLPLVNGELFLCCERNGWSLNNFNDELESTNLNEKITKVYGYSYTTSYAHNISKNYRDVLWERKEVKELTVAEIEKLLGYPVKIVKE